MKHLFNDKRIIAVRAVFPDNAAVRRLFVTNEGEKPIAQYAWRDLADTKHELLEANRTLLAKTQAEKREMNENENAAWDVVDHLLSVFNQEMSWRDVRGERGPRDPAAASQPADGAPVRRTGTWFRDLNTGREIRGVSHQEGLALSLPELTQPRGRIGELIASVVRGRPVSAEIEQDYRTMSIGSLSGGGYAVPAPFSMQFIDLARANSVVVQAGAVTVPMTGVTLRLARIEGDPTVAWKTENNAFSPSDLTLGALDLTARTVGCIIPGSEELWMDSPNIADIVEQAIRQKMGLEMDRVALVGSGVAPEPGGIMKSGTTANTGVQTFVAGGTSANYDFVSQLVQKVRTANHEPNAAVWHPRDLGVLDRLKDLQNQPLQPPRSFTELQHFATTSIPVNLESGASPNDASIAIVGKWSELIIAPRMDVMLLVSREAYDGTNNGFSKFQILVRAVARMDVGIARGAAFAVATGIND